MMEERKTLEEMLDQYSVAPAGAELREQILASAEKALDSRRRGNDKQGDGWIAILREEIFGWRPALPAMALALCFGVALGLMGNDEESADLVQMAAWQQDLEEDE